MIKTITSRKFYAFTLLAVIAIAVLLFQLATMKNILYKVYKWHLIQPETISGLIEVALIILFFSITILYVKDNLTMPILLFIVLLFLFLHGVLLPALVSVLYFESIIYVGRLGSKLIPRTRVNKNNYMLFFIVGLSIWSLVSMICSLVGLGSFNDLRIILIILLLFSLIKGLHAPALFHVIKKISEFKKYEKLPVLFLLLLVMIQFAKSNSLLAYEFDSIWYGLRPESVLVGANSFFDNLGFVSFVHVYPKLFELLLIPVSNLGDYSYILSINVMFYVMIIFVVYNFLKVLSNNRLFSIISTCLISSIPAFSNMASTAKTDLFSTFLIILGVYYLWQWIINLKNIKNDGGFNYFWVALSVFILSLGGKSTSMLYVPCIILGLVLYLYINKKEYQFKIIKNGLYIGKANLMIVLISLLVFLGVCFRTYKITGVPMYPIVGSLWSYLGFEMKYPFIVKNVGDTAMSFNISDAISRWYHLLFDPQPYGHVIMLWTGNVAFLLFIICLLLNIFNIKRLSKNNIMILVTPLLLVGIYYATFMPNGGDGNVYLVPLFMTIISLISFLSNFIIKWKKFSLIVCAMFISIQSLTLFVSHPSWSYGMSPVGQSLYSNNTQKLKEKLFEYHGIYNIDKYLKETGQLEKCLGLGDDYVLNQLSCRMETIGASASDYLGNSKIYSNSNELIEFIKWSDTKYIILPREKQEGTPQEYDILDDIRNYVKSNEAGKIISDTSYDLVIIDPSTFYFSQNEPIQFLEGWYNNEGSYRWINKNAEAKIKTGSDGKIRIRGTVPDVYQSIDLKIYINNKLNKIEKITPGQFDLEYQVPKNKGIDLRLESSDSFVPKEIGIGEDIRELSIIITSIDIS